MDFVEYCLSKGYKCESYSKNTWKECKYFPGIFSTMGTMSVRLIKNNIEIYYGLINVYHQGKTYLHSPTLIYPKLYPTIRELDLMFENQSYSKILKLINLYYINGLEETSLNL